MSDFLSTQYKLKIGGCNDKLYIDWKWLSTSIIVIEPRPRQIVKDDTCKDQEWIPTSRNKEWKMILTPLKTGHRKWRLIQLLQVNKTGNVRLGRGCPFFKIINDLNNGSKYTCYSFGLLVSWISNIKRRIGIENSIAENVCNEAFWNDTRLTLNEKKGVMSLFQTLDDITNAMNMNINYEYKTIFDLFNDNNNIQETVPFDIITINAPKIGILDATIKVILGEYCHDDIADIIVSFVPIKNYLQLQCLQQQPNQPNHHQQNTQQQQHLNQR